MAKGRKPAIGGLARPEGILDDVVYPIAGKAARKVANKFSIAKRARPSATAYNIYKKAVASENALDYRRGLSYYKKEKKNLYKMEEKLLGGKKVNKSAAKYARRSAVAGEKARAIVEGRPVRKMAKQTRRNYK
jgi:hypothetical protein